MALGRVGVVEAVQHADALVGTLQHPADWTQANDLAKEYPAKSAALQRLWLIEAVKYDVLPLDDRQLERITAETAGRPALITGNSQLLYGGMGRLSENSVVNIKNRTFAVTAEVEVPAGGADVTHAGSSRTHSAMSATCTEAGQPKETSVVPFLLRGPTLFGINHIR